MYKSTIIAGLLALAGSVSAVGCPANGINVAGSCICPSGYVYNNDCNTVNTGCPSGIITPTSNNTFSSAGMDLTTVDMNGTETEVTLGLKIPAAASRAYTGIYVAGPGVDPDTANCDQNDVFTSLTPQNAASTCTDQIQFRAQFEKLRSCGFTVRTSGEGSDANNDLVQTWEGTIRVMFTEDVTVGTGTFAQTVSRNASIDYPFRINFDSSYTFPMQVSNITVYAKQQVDFAIVEQVIPRDGTAPYIRIAYTVQFPYDISAWGTITAAPGGATSTPIAVTGITAMTTANECSFPGDYKASDTATTATCRKDDNTITFNPARTDDETCKFEGDQYTLPFTINCGQNVPPEDCPLATPDATGNSVTFTITSENFCVGRQAADTINGVINITEFYAAAQSNWALKQNAWRLDDNAFFVMKFSGLPLKTLVISDLSSKFEADMTALGNAPYVSVANSGGVTSITGANIGYSASGAPALATDQQGPPPGGNLGLQMVTIGDRSGGQEFRFQVTLNSALLDSKYNQVDRGEDWYLRLQATVQVTYDTLSARRRRQATGDVGAGAGTGVKEGEPQTVQAAETTAAEATPSSAMRAAPVLSLVLALLSAVLMA